MRGARYLSGMTMPHAQTIPVFESFVGGLRLFAQHWPLMFKMAFVPFGVTFLTLIVLRIFHEDIPVFLLPVLQLPSTFLVGLLSALMMRYLLLQEFPLIPEGPEKRARNRAIANSAFAYMAVTYFVSGMYVGILKLQALLQADPEMAAPYMPVGIAVLLFMLWGARWFWLQVPLALEWPVAAFYKRVGGWGGSLRIFALFALCSMAMNFLAGFFRLVSQMLFARISTGLAAAFDDALLSFATVTLALLFTMASVAAIRALMTENES